MSGLDYYDSDDTRNLGASDSGLKRQRSAMDVDDQTGSSKTMWPGQEGDEHISLDPKLKSAELASIETLIIVIPHQIERKLAQSRPKIALLGETCPLLHCKLQLPI